MKGSDGFAEYGCSGRPMEHKPWFRGRHDRGGAVRYRLRRRLPGADRRSGRDGVRAGGGQWGAGQRVELPPQRGGWSWEEDSIAGTELEAARERLQRRMRDTEAEIAEELAAQGWLTVIDGPLHNIRRAHPADHRLRQDPSSADAGRRGLETGSRPARRPALRSVCDARRPVWLLPAGRPGPWAGPWAGIVRQEVPAGVGLAPAVETADAAAGWLPAFASAPHRDERAPVNMAPVAGLERHLHHLQGDRRLALRAVRAAVMELNRAQAA